MRDRDGAGYPHAGEVERLLNARVPGGQAASRCGSKVEGPIVRGGESVIYRATCPGFDQPLLIKGLLDGRRTARSQYEALCLARDRLRGRCELLVPGVYPYLLDDGLLMMDWFAATTVRQLLHRPTLRLARMTAAIERSGRWLRAFHGDEQREFEPLRVDQLLAHTLALASGQKAGRFLHFRVYMDLLARTAPDVRSIPLPFAYSHGDFKPDNLLVEGRRVIAIDIDRVVKAPIIHDLTHFLLHLDLHLMHPRGWRFLPWRRRLQASFLRGYRLNLTREQTTALSWLSLQRTMQSFYEIRSRIEADKRRVRGSFLLYCYTVRADLWRREWRNHLVRGRR